MIVMPKITRFIDKDIKFFHGEMQSFLEKRYDMQALVTSGVGCYGPPLRIGTDSEIVIADITFD